MKKLPVFVLLLLIVTSAFSQRAGKKEKEDKKISFAGIPIVNYNRSIEFIFGGIGTVFYPINKQDTISPSSSTMVVGMYATNKTSMLLGVQQLYLKQDIWRSTLAVGSGNIFFQYFQGLPTLPPPAGINDGDEGIWIDFNTEMKFFYFDVKRKVIGDLYAGVLFLGNRTITTFDIDVPGLPPTEADLFSLGYNLSYDTRDNVNFPTKGIFAQFENSFIREAFGATQDFNKYKVVFNHFLDLRKNSKSILVSRFYADVASGDVPFQGQNVIGRDDLRGYAQGEFRGNQVYALQAELRQNVHKRFGVIGFLGFGLAVEKIADIGSAPFLPSAGGGIRYQMIPKEGINIGFDAGVGRNDWSLTFRIGETFGR